MFILHLWRRRLWVISLVMLLPLLMLISANFKPVATDVELRGFFVCTQVFYPFLVGLFITYLLCDRREMELIVLSGGSIAEQAIYDWLITVGSSLPAGMSAVAFLPKWISGNHIISFAVNLLFFTALGVFAHFAIGSRIGGSVVYIGCYFTLYELSGLAEDAVISYDLSSRDVMMSAYAHEILADEVGCWFIIRSAWISNRVVFAVIGVLLLAGGILLTRQKRLYDVRS